VNPFAVVVNRHRELFLGGLLSNHVLIEEFFYFEGLGKLVRTGGGGFRSVVLEDRIANRDALVAYICSRIVAGGRNEFPDNVLTLMAKRTAKSLVRSCTLHAYLP
jgi:hypothetical protein